MVIFILHDTLAHLVWLVLYGCRSSTPHAPHYFSSVQWRYRHINHITSTYIGAAASDRSTLEVMCPISGLKFHLRPHLIATFFFCCTLRCRVCLLLCIRLGTQSSTADVGESFYSELPGRFLKNYVVKFFLCSFSILFFFVCVSFRGMFTPVEGRQKILSSDPGAQLPPPLLTSPTHWSLGTGGEVNMRSRCHFNASGVFLPLNGGLWPIPLLRSVCVYVGL